MAKPRKIHCEPITYELTPGYCAAVAADSPRRAEAQRIVEELLESRTSDRMRFVTLT